MGSFANRRETNETGLTVPGITRREALALAALGLAAPPGFAFAAEPEGRLTWGIHVSLAPTWFDPAETPGIITPFMILYALHDGMAKPMPGQPLAPSSPSRFQRPRMASATSLRCAQAQNSTMATRSRPRTSSSRSSAIAAPPMT